MFFVFVQLKSSGVVEQHRGSDFDEAAVGGQDINHFTVHQRSEVTLTVGSSGLGSDLTQGFLWVTEVHFNMEDVLRITNVSSSSNFLH